MKGAREEERGLVLDVLVVPRASRAQFCGLHGDRWKVKVCAPPVDGAANEALCRALAAHFSIASSCVEIVAGHCGRRKTVRLDGVTMDALSEVAHG